MKIVVATNNKNKLFEIKEKFKIVKNLELLSLAEFSNIPEIIEDGKTFEENAIIKAKKIAEITNMIAIADDSGLVVDALDGRPGIYSARYGGEGTSDVDKYLLLLEEMKEKENRDCRFVCSIAIVSPQGKIYTTEGVCNGKIARVPSGGKGFGYDPIFFLPEYDKSMAEISIEEKNKISHRAIALEKAKGIIGEM